MDTLSTANTDEAPVPNKFIPVDQDNTSIVFNGNPAHMLGVLHECWQWMQRTGFHLNLLEEHTVLLPTYCM